MIKCEICEKEYNSFKSLLSHIKMHKISSKEYYDKYLKKENEGICIECGKETVFNRINKGYNIYCSCKCSANSNETKMKKEETCLEKYGCENVFQNEEVKDKIKKDNLEKYGVEYLLQNKEIKEKQEQTCLKNYGVKNPSQNKEIKEKIKEINLNKSEGEKEQIQNKRKETCLEKYNCENVFQNEEMIKKIKKINLSKSEEEKKLIKNKRKETCLEKYNVEYSLQSKEVREKIEQTCLEIYNYRNPGQNKEIKEKIEETRIKNINIKLYELLKYNKLELLSNYNNARELLKLKCKTCDNIFETTYFNLYQECGKCPKCFPKYRSSDEIELSDFIKSIEPLEIIENDRTILNGKELDIYIPSKNIAIEFNGLYWHSEASGNKNRNYHLNKTELCESKNIVLVHIFEDEWINKKEIVKSRLRQLLKVNNTKRIHARKCEIIQIDPRLKNEFLNKYHIQGTDNSRIKIGAFYDWQLVAVMTFSKGNISKGAKNIEGVWELSRFCSNSNYHIPGIAGKLLSYFKKRYMWKEIFSYADRRWSQGNLYFKIGFELNSVTKPNYFYIVNMKRIHRFNFRKRPDEPKDVTEWILRQQEGLDRIWDSGNLKFRMINNEIK